MGSAATEAVIVPTHTFVSEAGSATSAPSVNRPQAEGSPHELVAPIEKDDAIPVAGVNELYASVPESCAVLHSDSRHIRNTSICDELSRAAVTIGYGGEPAPGSSDAFSKQSSIVTVSPSWMALGSHGVKPGQMLGRKDADALHTDMPVRNFRSKERGSIKQGSSKSSTRVHSTLLNRSSIEIRRGARYVLLL